MKSLSNRHCNENARLINDRRRAEGNRFATDDGAESKENVGLTDRPSDRAPPRVPEVD